MQYVIDWNNILLWNTSAKCARPLREKSRRKIPEQWQPGILTRDQVSFNGHWEFDNDARSGPGRKPNCVREILQKESISSSLKIIPCTVRNESPQIAEPLNSWVALWLARKFAGYLPCPSNMVRWSPKNNNDASTENQQHSSRRNRDAGCSRSFERI